MKWQSAYFFVFSSIWKAFRDQIHRRGWAAAAAKEELSDWWIGKEQRHLFDSLNHSSPPVKLFHYHHLARQTLSICFPPLCRSLVFRLWLPRLTSSFLRHRRFISPSSSFTTTQNTRIRLSSRWGWADLSWLLRRCVFGSQEKEVEWLFSSVIWNLSSSSTPNTPPHPLPTHNIWLVHRRVSSTSIIQTSLDTVSGQFSALHNATQKRQYNSRTESRSRIPRNTEIKSAKWNNFDFNGKWVTHHFLTTFSVAKLYLT